MKNIKNQYREYFKDMQKYVKMSQVLNDLGLSSPNYYRFMKSEDFNYCLSVETLELIYNQLRQVIKCSE